MNIVAADSNALIRAGLSGMIRSLPELAGAEVHEAEELGALRRILGKLEADIVIVESAMVEDSLTPDLVSIVGRMRRTHWVILAHKASRLVLHFVREHSNFSIILKNCGREEILSCLRLAAEKEQLICAECRAQLSHMDENSRNSPLLTPAECMVLALLAQGLKVKDIAELQFRSKHTIRTHKRDIFEKLGVNTTVEAIMTAYKLGIISPPEQTV